MKKPEALLVPVRYETQRFTWVEGYQVITPTGSSIYPYMSKGRARAYCKDQGWKTRVKR